MPKRIDANQKSIVRGLREIGASVQSLAKVGFGCPDLLVGWRGVNVVLEVKDGDKVESRRRLTEAEADWQEKWKGQVETVNSFDEALAVLRRQV